jgi:hypothetical protein
MSDAGITAGALTARSRRSRELQRPGRVFRVNARRSPGSRCRNGRLKRGARFCSPRPPCFATGWATTLRDIAWCRHWCRQFHYYFRSKEEVLHEVLDRGIETVDNMVRGAVNVLPPSATPLTQSAGDPGHLRALLDKSGLRPGRAFTTSCRESFRPDHPRRLSYQPLA